MDPLARGALLFATVSLLGPLCIGAQSALAQYGSDVDLAAGTILLANEKLQDPNFAESIVLVLEHDDDGTLGIIINRPSRVSLSQLFPDIKHAANDPVYAGGPVGVSFGQALVRSTEKLENARPVEGDVYATGEKKVIEKFVSSHTIASRFRLYLGYAGWAPDQLEAEIRIGAWTILRRGPAIIFDSEPETLWDRLTRESQMRIAKRTPLAPFWSSVSFRPN